MRKAHISCLRTAWLCSWLLAFPAFAQPLPGVTAHEKAAHEFYLLVGGSSIARAGADATLYGVISVNPQLTDYQDVVRDWYQKLLSNREMESDISKLYMKQFSEKELKDLIGFYHTRLGKKLLESLPDVVRQTLILGVKHVAGHSQELEEKLGEAIERKDLDSDSDETE